MTPFLSSIGALFALAAVPALVAIYLFQRRFRSREVSSLLLWNAVRQASLGGRTREPLRMPLAFWLELAAILLLVLAAAGPLLPWRSAARPLVIVLDDSLSMRAGEPDSPRKAGEAFVRELARRGAHEPLHIVFAGPAPQLAGGGTLDESLRRWTCAAPSAGLDGAIGFATQLGGPTALVQVVTDRAPAAPIDAGRLAWRSFGAPRANVAFAAAARSDGGRDRVLLEIASYATTPQRRTLTMGDGRTTELTLRPGERRRLHIDTRSPAPFEAHLSADDVPFDDRVILIPEQKPSLRVALAIRNRDLRDEVERALRATGRVTISDVRADLVVTDGRAPADGWSVVIDGTPSTTASAGPYVADRSHPLIRGLTFDGLIWAGRRNVPAAGEPLLLVGSNAWIATEQVKGGERVTMRLDVAHSNVTRAPFWPAFWWNVVDWRHAHTPGARASNILLGGDARVVVQQPRAEVVAPDGVRRDVDAVDGVVTMTAGQPGLWVIDGHRVAVNAILPAESDLSGAATGTWGGWTPDSMVAAGYRDVAWVLVLLALAILIGHQWLLSKPHAAASAPGAVP